MAAKALTVPQFKRYLTSRKAKGSMASIARDLGVTRQAVKQWVDGDTEPSKLVLLVAAMHIQIEKRVH